MNKRKTKRWKQLIAAMLAIILMMTSVELPAKAAPAEETVTTEETEELNVTESVPEVSDDSLDDSEEETEPRILTEVEEKREEDQKTFLMSDGTFMVASYGMPVHYKDDNGNWQELDYSLKEETEEEYTTTEKAGKQEQIRFSKKLKEGKTVSIKNTDYPIAWGIKDAVKQTVEIITSENEEPEKWNDKFLFVDNGFRTVRYADIFDGIDVEYIVQSAGVKENIILKTPGTKTSFEIVYDIGKLTPVQADE